MDVVLSGVVDMIIYSSLAWWYLDHPGKTQVLMVTGRFPLDLGGCLARETALFLKFYTIWV